MSNKYFDFSGENVVFRTASACAGRRAVLYPLTGKSPTVVAAVEKLLKIWRARYALVSPRAARLPNIDTPKAIRYLTCHPAGIRSNRKHWHCGFSSFCPWCYSREVSAVFNCIEAVCKTDTRDCLLLIRTRPPNKIPIDGDVREGIKITLQGLSKARGRFRNKFNSVAGAAFMTLAPFEDQWTFVTRQLFIVPADKKIKLRKAGDYDICRLSDSLLYLPDIVGNFLQYPTGLMFGDVANTALLLDVQKEIKHRRFSLFGEFAKRNFDYDTDADTTADTDDATGQDADSVSVG